MDMTNAWRSQPDTLPIMKGKHLNLSYDISKLESGTRS